MSNKGTPVVIVMGPEERLREYDEQILRLATFIMSEIPGEPSRSESAIDCAIRLLKKMAVRTKNSEERLPAKEFWKEFRKGRDASETWNPEALTPDVMFTFAEAYRQQFFAAAPAEDAKEK